MLGTYYKPRLRRIVAVTLWHLAALICSPGVSLALTADYMSYADLTHLSVQEIERAQVKFTWIGPTYGNVPSVILYVGDHEPPDLVAPFRSFYRSELDYAMDAFGAGGAEISAAEFRSLVAALGQIPEIASGLFDSSDYLEIAIVVSTAVPQGFNATVKHESSDAFFDGLRTALGTTSRAAVKLNRLASLMDSSDPNRPLEATSMTTVSFGAMRRDAGSDHFLVTATIVNNLDVPLPAPISLLIGGIPFSGELVNKVDFSDKAGPRWQYLNAPVPPDGLAGKASIEVQLEIANPNMVKLNLQARVLAGPGAR